MDHQYSVNAIYPTYQGEQNFRGIGAPVIFLRLQGCHLRCYAKTLGVLCDTPEGLEKGEPNMDFSEILGTLNNIRRNTGIDYVCLSGGDPLWRKKDDIHYLLTQLSYAGFYVSVETSGTLSISPYRDIRNIYWVLDYKVKSAGLPNKFVHSDLPLLTEADIVKFVLYDYADYLEFKEVFHNITTKAKIVVGTYWGGELKSNILLEDLVKDGILGKVRINAQLHKLLTHADRTDVSKTIIPKEL